MTEETNTPTPERAAFSVAVKCTACGQVGSILWEENAFPSPGGPRRTLVLASGGFHANDVRGASGDPQIVCDHCNTILED